MKSWYKIAQETEEDYRGGHQSPSKAGGAPLYDVTAIYPDDIYSPMANQYYGGYYPSDSLCINIIQDYKDKPNATVKIYRAVPDFHFDTKKEIKTLSKILSYHMKFNFFPMDSETIQEAEEKYPIEEHEYEEQQKLIYQDIQNRIDQLQSIKQDKLSINQGDWVSLTRSYAKDHGESTLLGKYKILSKTVKAKDLFTDGNSVQEWGYDPQ